MFQVGWMFSNSLGMFYQSIQKVGPAPPPPTATELVTQAGDYLLTDSGDYIVVQ
jgi:hypothetical protein